jgi:hypothetical protein
MALEQQLQGILNVRLIVRHQNASGQGTSGCDLGSIRQEGL